jgi:hypothetical protein
MNIITQLRIIQSKETFKEIHMKNLNADLFSENLKYLYPNKVVLENSCQLKLYEIPELVVTIMISLIN